MLAVTINERPFRGLQQRLDGVVVTEGCGKRACGQGTPRPGSAVTIGDSFLTVWIWAESGDYSGNTEVFSVAQAAHLNFGILVFGTFRSQVCFSLPPPSPA